MPVFDLGKGVTSPASLSLDRFAWVPEIVGQLGSSLVSRRENMPCDRMGELARSVHLPPLVAASPRLTMGIWRRYRSGKVRAINLWIFQIINDIPYSRLARRIGCEILGTGMHPCSVAWREASSGCMRCVRNQGPLFLSHSSLESFRPMRAMTWLSRTKFEWPQHLEHDLDTISRLLWHL